MMPSPSELQYFVEVAGTLNISRAAERLGISQPTLSLAIQRLEASLGVPLLIRNKSGVRLTQGGQKLVAQARHLIHEWERIRGDALKAESRITGRYTLGCHPSVAVYSLPSFLPRLLEENRELEIKLVHDLSRRITEDVISFKVDFGIVVNPVEHPDLVIKLLCRDEVTLWTGKGSRSVQDPHSGEGVLICDPDLLQSQSLMKQISKKGMVFKRTVTSSNLEVVTALTAAGAGVGILPGRVATHVKALGLRPLGKDTPSFQDRICLVYRADAQKSQASREIARTIERNMNPDPSP
jgi:LysR family transcriptional regulator, cell division regulator